MNEELRNDRKAGFSYWTEAVGKAFHLLSNMLPSS